MGAGGWSHPWHIPAQQDSWAHLTGGDAAAVGYSCSQEREETPCFSLPGTLLFSTSAFQGRQLTRDKCARQPRNVESRDTEQNKGHHKHMVIRVPASWQNTSTQGHVKFLFLSVKQLSQIPVKFENYSTLTIFDFYCGKIYLT